MTPPTLPGTEWTGDIDGGDMPICVTTANGRARAWWWDSSGEPQWRATGGDPIDVGPWKLWALSLRAERDEARAARDGLRIALDQRIADDATRGKLGPGWFDHGGP